MHDKIKEVLGDLPVNDVIDEVVNSYTSSSKSVTILSIATGSGKTLVTPYELSHILNDDERIVVLEPRRSLATNAAETVSKIIDDAVGNYIGYGVGSKIDYKSKFSNQTTVLY